uniref:Uncharacterized protein n=1 Tax=Mycena chlorophos TaxID=658473 RepID=A0ABQ0LVX5_MYCCL|nr:predicted protein [Mycena chlorophos]
MADEIVPPSPSSDSSSSSIPTVATRDSNEADGPPSTLTDEIDINDLNREKIVIRALPKAFAQKQRGAVSTLRRNTVPCFTTESPNKEQVATRRASVPGPSMWIPGPEDSILPSRKWRLKQKLREEHYSRSSKSSNSSPKTPGTSANSIPITPELSKSSPYYRPADSPILDAAFEHCTPSPHPLDAYPSFGRSPPPSPSARYAPPAKPLEGRIEKQRAPSPPRVIEFSAPPEHLFSCGCSRPEGCKRCTMGRLIDQFCAIVRARRERLRLEANLQQI